MMRADILHNLFPQRKRVGDMVIDLSCSKATLIFSALLLLATTSCTAWNNIHNLDYGYKRPFNFEDPKYLKNDYTNPNNPKWFRHQYDVDMAANDFDNARLERDQILSELMYAIDAAHGQYERNTRIGKDTLDFISDIGILGTNAAGTVTGTAEIKSILHAISGGIASTQSAATNRFLADQAIEAIQTQMRAQMKERKADIIKNMQQDVKKYTLDMGLSDIVNYYYDGTFTRALQNMTKSATDKEQQAKTDVKDAINGTKTTTTTNVTKDTDNNPPTGEQTQKDSHKPKPK